MVATLLKLRWRAQWNTLTASPWLLVGYILGAVWALWAVALIAVGLVALSFADAEVTATTVTAFGIILTLGWVLVPLFLGGVDTTLDLSRLRPFPLTPRQVMLALALAGLTGVAGIATSLISLALFGSFFRSPPALLSLPVVIPVGVLSCVVASRLVATLTDGGARRVREIAGTIAIVAVMMTGPIIVGVSAAISAIVSGGGASASLIPLLEALAWTPLGAIWAVPGDLATGEVLVGVLRGAIGVATLAALWALWRRALGARMANPARPRAAVRRSDSLGLFGIASSTPLGATWARSLATWVRDPRYLRQLAIVPVLPMIFSIGSGSTPNFLYSAVFVAVIMSLFTYTDISYDGTAFAAVLAAGVRGRDDRLGRSLAAATVFLPLLAIIAGACTAISGRLDLLPGILGSAFGFALTGLGVGAMSSAAIVTPAPAPGDSPFKRVPGQNGLIGFLAFGLFFVVGVLGSPALILTIVGHVTANGALVWAALPVGIAIGVVFLVVGVIVGGRTFDAKGPELLARLRSFSAA